MALTRGFNAPLCLTLNGRSSGTAPSTRIRNETALLLWPADLNNRAIKLDRLEKPASISIQSLPSKTRSQTRMPSPKVRKTLEFPLLLLRFTKTRQPRLRFQTTRLLRALRPVPNVWIPCLIGMIWTNNWWKENLRTVPMSTATN
jgi:hypothetical protein